MAAAHRARLPVTERSHVVGLVTQRDVTRALAFRAPWSDHWSDAWTRRIDPTQRSDAGVRRPSGTDPAANPPVVSDGEG